MKRDSRTINFTGCLLAAIGVMTIMSFILVSCGGGGGGGGYGSGGSTTYYSITGTVTSGGTGLAGVTMTLSGASAATTTTNSSGNFTFGNLANGNYTVTPSKTGFTFTPPSSAKTVSGANITAVDFIATAVPTFSISGTVTSGGTGLASVTMTLSGSGSATTSTDASGNYTFTGLANGSYTITPSKTGFTFTPPNSPQTVNSANITAVDFTAVAVPTFSISGTVTSGGTGLAGATMTLSGSGSATTSTDASGNYTFTGLANGSYTVTPTKSGLTFTPTNSPQTVNSANITGVNFTAASTLTVQLVACPGSGTTDVAIQDFFFNPANISVSVNSIVRWTNNGGTDHTVTSTTVPANGAFDSSLVSPGTSVCFKFTSGGTFNYHCSIHSSMTGVVTVQ